MKEYKTDSDPCVTGSFANLQSGRWTYLTEPHFELGLGICGESYWKSTSCSFHVLPKKIFSIYHWTTRLGTWKQKNRSKNSKTLEHLRNTVCLEHLQLQKKKGKGPNKNLRFLWRWVEPQKRMTICFNMQNENAVDSECGRKHRPNKKSAFKQLLY